MQKLKKTSYILCVTVLSFCKTKTRRGLQIIIHNCPKKNVSNMGTKTYFFRISSTLAFSKYTCDVFS